ncbi:hypothetical protein [uncultured Ruminobacter sp.]|uniref:hypothetical protein n=1 Tax=uncultured Ruminobacter sp. TaxID=538947 RepID=UPI0025CC8122|nr:hypothetical protein [uncultured Ruminobacter sp.]
MKKATYLYCLAGIGLLSLPGGAYALTSHSCGDSLYEFVQTCRDAEKVLPKKTQKNLYNNVAVNCFPTAFQANNGADVTPGNAANTPISTCDDITNSLDYLTSFDLFKQSNGPSVNINQKIASNKSCKIGTIQSSSTSGMNNHQQFCYATVGNRHVKTKAKNLHNISDFYRDFVMQDSDPEKEQFRKDNLAKAKKNCGDSFEYYIDSSSVENGGIDLPLNKIIIINKYVFGSNTVTYMASGNPPVPQQIVIAENNITVTRDPDYPYYDAAAYLISSGRVTLTDVGSFTGGINARELELVELKCNYGWLFGYFSYWDNCSNSDSFEVTGYTTLSACEDVVLEDEITYTYYRVYLEQLSNCSPTVSLVVQKCSQGGFCETPTAPLNIRLNGHTYTVNAQNNYRITFDHGDPVRYTAEPTEQYTYFFCGTSNTASLSESCSFTTNECVEGATEDLENYVNDMNVKAIYSDTLSSDVKSVDSIKLILKGNTEIKIKDSDNHTYTLFSGKDHATNFTEEYVTLPVEYNRTTGAIVPKFKFITTADRGTLYPVKTELNVTKSTYIGNREVTSSDVITREFNQGATPDQYIVAVPYALCYDLMTTQPTDSTRTDNSKYRLLYANAPYYLRGYAVACPDSGCTASVNQTNLKNVCSSANIIKIPQAGSNSKSVRAPTEGATSILPEKISNWSTALTGYTVSTEKTANFTVYNGDNETETEYLKIGYTGDIPNGKRVRITDSGWYSLSAEPVIKPQSSSSVSTHVYSPVFTVIPMSLGIGNDSYVINDFYKFREANGFGYRSSGTGLTGILRSDAYVNAGTSTCPMYYNQKLTFSGYLNSYGYATKLQNGFTEKFYRIPGTADRSYDGVVLIMPLASTATAYREEASFDPCSSDTTVSCSGYDDYIADKGIPFHTTITVPGVSTDTLRRKTASEKFAYYAKLNACMANNTAYTFSESSDCAETGFTCGTDDQLCVSKNSVTTADTDVSGAVLNTNHQQYASKLRSLNDYTVHMGRIVTDNIIGTYTVDGGNTESGTLYSPLSIKEYTDSGWKDLSDNCSVLYITDEDSYKSSLDYSNQKGTITFNICTKMHDKIATDCSDKHRTFANGALWLQAVKSGTGDAYVTYTLKNETGGLNTTPFFHLEHLYDANTAKGSFKFNTFVGNKRIIERKINTGTR